MNRLIVSLFLVLSIFPAAPCTAEDIPPLEFSPFELTLVAFSKEIEYKTVVQNGVKKKLERDIYVQSLDKDVFKQKRVELTFAIPKPATIEFTTGWNDYSLGRAWIRLPGKGTRTITGSRPGTKEVKISSRDLGNQKYLELVVDITRVKNTTNAKISYAFKNTWRPSQSSPSTGGSSSGGEHSGSGGSSSTANSTENKRILKLEREVRDLRGTLSKVLGQIKKMNWRLDKIDPSGADRNR